METFKELCARLRRPDDPEGLCPQQNYESELWLAQFQSRQIREKMLADCGLPIVYAEGAKSSLPPLLVPCQCGEMSATQAGWDAQGYYEDLPDGNIKLHDLPPDGCRIHKEEKEFGHDDPHSLLPPILVE